MLFLTQGGMLLKNQLSGAGTIVQVAGQVLAWHVSNPGSIPTIMVPKAEVIPVCRVRSNP